MSHFIAGQWLEGDGEALVSVDPATGETVYQTTHATTEEINHAVNAAKDAFLPWAQLPIEKRAQYLQKFCECLTERRKEFVLAIAKETGKPLWESDTEVGAMLNKLPLTLQAYEERSGELSEDTAPGVHLKVTHRPHGVLAILGPFNFPGHLPNGHIMPALLAGNTLVLKPSEFAPAVAKLMLQCWEQAALPAGVLNMIQGGRDTAQALVKHDALAGVLFTGSYAAGKWLHQHFAGQPEKLLALEMGGNNPLIVAETKQIDAAVYNIIQSAFVTAGQRCTCARRLIIVEDETTPALLEKLVATAKNLQIGHYDQTPAPFMGPVISKESAQRLVKAQEELTNAGAKRLLSLEHPDKNTGFVSAGILDVTELPEIDTEYFGPLLQVRRVASFEDAIQTANNTQYGLAAGLLCDNKVLFDQFYVQARAGIVNWNRPLTGASSRTPFGGIGHSGNLRPSAYYAADYCAYPMASLFNDVLALPETLTPGVTLV